MTHSGGIMRQILFIFVLPLLFSCGASDEEKLENAVELAHIYLSESNCSAAHSALDSLSGVNDKANYIEARAAAYACDADFSEIDFVTSDIEKIAASGNILGGLTLMSTSPMTRSDDVKFGKLQKGIDTILYAGDVQTPTHAAREEVFSGAELRNMNMQAILMVLAQMGKYFYYYGSTGGTGQKGGNGSGAKCLYGGYGYSTYAAGGTVPLPTLNMFVDNSPCEITNWDQTDTVADAADWESAQGHADLTGDTTEVTARMCRGVTLFNSFLDLLVNTTLSVAEELGDIGDLSDQFSTFQTLCETSLTQLSDNGATIDGRICSITDYDLCVELFDKTTEGPKLELQIFFGFVFEALLTDG